MSPSSRVSSRRRSCPPPSSSGFKQEPPLTRLSEVPFGVIQNAISREGDASTDRGANQGR